MKILIFTSEMTGKDGWSRYSRDLISSLIRSGHDVKIICHHRDEIFSKLDQYEILSSPLSYRANYLLFWLAALEALFFVRKSKVDIVHCLVETYAPAAWLYSKLVGKSFFLTVHGSFGLKPLTFRFAGWLQKKVYSSKQTLVICVSNYTKKRLASKLGFSPRTLVIPNGVFLSGAETIRGPRSCPSDNPVLLGVGALKQRKGFHLVVEALPIVIKKFPDIVYRIIGNQSDQDYVGKLRKRIEELGISPNVFFHENVDDEKLKFFYESADLFVLTPLSDEYNFEGFGLVYLEANSFGLPVVGMKENGGEEAIKNGETGVLAEVDDIQSIADSIIGILSNEKKYVMMSENALRQAQSHNWPVIIERYLEAYRDFTASFVNQ